MPNKPYGKELATERGLSTQKGRGERGRGDSEVRKLLFIIILLLRMSSDCSNLSAVSEVLRVGETNKSRRIRRIEG